MLSLLPKLLLNLQFFSVGFVFYAARYPEKITVKNAMRLILTGVCLLLLALCFGVFMSHKTIAATLFEINSGNDHQMGVIYGVSALYLAFLCGVWNVSRYFFHPQVKAK
ncbi:hypothetical protein H8L32_22085 [Undibacterium sp. CY18W]|uniref:Uncharacterized protein n=1 Tax=Undibacterium hunanense TaxID=2762292 RepID=A0ABR6ZWL4_9BURK|nr:hypothetical protein [Undibacterium hunanense]MBC3920169.1 hypothetical protein [Undibacterium hunanense]